MKIRIQIKSNIFLFTLSILILQSCLTKHEYDTPFKQIANYKESEIDINEYPFIFPVLSKPYSGLDVNHCDYQILKAKINIENGATTNPQKANALNTCDNNNPFTKIEHFITTTKEKITSSELFDSKLQILDSLRKNLHYSKFINLYYDVKLTLLEGDIKYEQGFSLQASSSYQYALYKIETSPFIINKLKDQCISKIVNRLVKDLPSELTTQTLCEKYLQKTSIEYQQLIEYRMLSLQVEEISLPQEELISRWEKITLEASTLREVVASNTNIAILYEGKLDSLNAKKYYRRNLNKLSDSGCNYLRLVNLILSYGYLTKEEIENEKSELFCSEKMEDNFNFLFYHYVNIESSKLKVKDKINTLMKKRTLADKLHHGKARLHLQDYYLKNSINVFKLMLQRKNSEQDITNLFEILDDTKERERFRRLNLIDSSFLQHPSDNPFTLLSQKLRYVSDFQNIKPFDDPVYKELYFLFQQINSINDNPQKVNSISSNNLRSKKSLNSNLLYITLMKDNYYFCLLNKNKSFLEVINKSKIDSLSIDLLNRIDNKSDVNNIKKGLIESISISSDIDTSLALVLIADGIVAQLPWSIIFPNLAIHRFENYNSSLNIPNTQLIGNNTLLASYTDESTLKNQKPIKVPELSFGFLEIDSLKEILNQPKILSGKNFTKENLIKNMNVDVMHISSHASYRQSRLENYFTVRDMNGNEMPFYSYEIYSLPYHPKVAFLSMCDSGNGFFTEGSGTYALSKAFLDNGTQTVVKTIWPVNEKASYHLVINTYKFWNMNTSLYEALELAKQKVRNMPEYSHPYYWAGFVLEGNPNIYLKK